MKIRFENVFFRYDHKLPQSKDVLRDVSFEINSGEMVGLVGPSGSGKTTVMQHFNGLLRPTAGKITIDNDDIFQSKFRIQQIREMIGLVFQFPENQLFAETVAADIAFGLKKFNLSKVEIKERVFRALNFVGLNYDQFYNRSPHSLSEGEKRRIALAGILVMSPKMLILDEPTAGLDSAGTKLMIDILRRLNEAGTTILLITHNMNLLLKISRRLILLYEGKILLDRPLNEIFNHQEIFNQSNFEVPEILKFCFFLYQKQILPDWRIYSVDELIALLKPE